MMKQWMADFEVISHVSIVDDNQRLKFKHPNNEYEIHLKNLDARPAQDNPTLSVQILFYYDDEEKLVSVARSKLNSFLMILSLVTSSKIVIRGLKRIIDCTEGLEQQKCYQYLRTADPNIPFKYLNEDVLNTTGALLTNSHEDELWEALKWYTFGIAASYTDEQFQYFWLALEILAERSKTTEAVSDRCSKCRTPLYCPECKKESTHKPYAKQAIEQLVDRRHSGRGHEKIFPMLNDFRNALFHGGSVEACEKKHKIGLCEATDVIGKIAFCEILSTMKLPPETSKLAIVESKTYAHQELICKANMVIGNSKPNGLKPEIEDFSSVDVSIQIGEKTPDGNMRVCNEIKT